MKGTSTHPTALENLLWSIAAAVVPLIVWRAGYDSFHEPKWLVFTGLVGLLLMVRSVQGPQLFKPLNPLDLPLLFGLAVTFLALRWDAGDRGVAFLFWSRLVVGYLLFRLCASWLSSPGEERGERVRRLQNAFVCGGAAVAALAILQDWIPATRWGQGPVSDWRFHLSSTLGNPNEVGGYLSYLLPILLVRWLGNSDPAGTRWVWGLLGVLYLYALTTVFTVGAWLGLFVVLPITICAITTPGEKSRSGLISRGALASILLFAVLQGTLRYPGETGRSLVFLVLAVICGIGVWTLVRNFDAPWKSRTLWATLVLVVIWATLLLPWGLPNHPEGLVQEAVSSPRWKGGFGARRFIWQTTGLMVKDHPARGIGWGRYYTVHALYQGEVYRQRDLPHDRSTVGLVPQAHSDPLQFLAEAGPLGILGFAWIAAAAFLLGYRRIQTYNVDDPDKASNLWAAWAGLGLIFFHSLVDFPLRQPQPIFLAVLSLAILTARKKESDFGRASFLSKAGLLPLGLLLLATSALGFFDQARLKAGFEALNRAGKATDLTQRAALLDRAENALDSIRFPVPETHDRWIYRAQVALEKGSIQSAKSALREAAKYRQSLSLYHTWAELGSRLRDPEISLGAVKGLLRYNPCWGPYHEDAARLARLLGKDELAKEFEKNAEKFQAR